MPLNLNSVLTIIALVVAGTSAYFTWQIGTEKKLQSLEFTVAQNRSDIEKLQANLPSAETIRIAVEEEIARVVDLAVQKSSVKEFNYLGEVSCGIPSKFPVPEPNTTTADWIVLGIDPYINTEFKNDGVFNNALLGFGTIITSTANGKEWRVSFNVRANLATSQHEDIANCNKSTSKSGKSLTGEPSKIHVVAFRKPTE